MICSVFQNTCTKWWAAMKFFLVKLPREPGHCPPKKNNRRVSVRPRRKKTLPVEKIQDMVHFWPAENRYNPSTSWYFCVGSATTQGSTTCPALSTRRCSTSVFLRQPPITSLPSHRPPHTTCSTQTIAPLCTTPSLPSITSSPQTIYSQFLQHSWP